MNESLKLRNACPFCGKQLADDPRRTCHHCVTSDRNRCVRILYEALRPLLSDLRCLNLTADKVVLNQAYFNDVLNSVYMGENHIDLQNIGWPDDSFDFTVCNHVLEHIPDDKRSILELVRITSKAVQITVPVTSFVYDGVEYGRPDPKMHGHFRHYGADFGSRVKAIVPQCHVLVTVQTDELSGNYDTSYLVTKDHEFARQAYKRLRETSIPCVVIS